MAGEWNRFVWAYDPVDSGHTPTNILNVLSSALTQSGWESAPWSSDLLVNTEGVNARYFLRTDRVSNRSWGYNGDGWDQDCGLLIRYIPASNQIRLYSFLENSDKTGPYRRTADAGDARITIDNTAPNNYLIVCGEDGMCVEVGRDGLAVNLAHAVIGRHTTIAEFYGTREVASKWTTQGHVLDLFGSLRCTSDRNQRLVVTDGSNHNVTARISAIAVRGTDSLFAQNPANDRRYYIGPRDNLLTCRHGGSYGNDLADFCGFMLPWGVQDEKYRVSPLYLIQAYHTIGIQASSSSSANNLAPNGYGYVLDYRNLRVIPRFVAVDHTILPNTFIQDQATSKFYRVQRIEDNGRYCNIGVEWPAANYLPVSIA